MQVGLEWPFGDDTPDYTYGDCGDRATAGFYFVAFKLVCESVMLNLFIGMIIENFSFITGETELVEDDEWSEGASSHQIESLARYTSVQGLTVLCLIRLSHSRCKVWVWGLRVLCLIRLSRVRHESMTITFAPFEALNPKPSNWQVVPAVSAATNWHHLYSGTDNHDAKPPCTPGIPQH